jgi:hypothetical protein
MSRLPVRSARCQTAATGSRLAGVAAMVATAAIAAATALPAQAADGPMNIGNPSGLRSGELPDTLRDRGGLEQGATSTTRKELFVLQNMTFSLVDHTASSTFVRLLPASVREAEVRVVDRTRALDKTFLYRTKCDARTFYFGPAPKDDAASAPTLKPIEDGSVGDLLFKQICAG